MIELGFTINREVVRFQIVDKQITYFDRKWIKGIRFMPKDVLLVKHLLAHQRVFPLAQNIVGWINEANSGKFLDEYNSCKTDEELANIVRRDALSKGLVEIKSERSAH